MTNTKYIKDIRSFSDRPSFSYDGKYQYLSWKEADSIFSDQQITKKLKKVSQSLIVEFLALLPNNYKIAAYPGLKKTQQIAILIQSGASFNVSDATWNLFGEVSEDDACDSNQAFEEPSLNYDSCNIETTSITENTQVYTTCVLNEPLNSNFVRVLGFFCKKNNADLHIFFKSRTIREDCGDWQGLLSELSMLLDGVNVFKHFSGDHKSYDGNLKVKPSLNINFTAIKPLASVLNLADTRYFVVPHPRQALEITYSQKTADKSLVMTTGCLNDVGGGSTRIKAQTSFHSVLGACIYNSRRENYKIVGVNASTTGFYYFDEHYFLNEDGFPSVAQAKADSIYLDDLHCSMIDYRYKNLLVKLISLLKPNQVISGDIFDGSSMNHHEAGNLGYSGKRMSLNHEVKMTQDVVIDLINAMPTASKFVWLSSNHHNFVAKYLAKPSLLNHLRPDELPLVLRSMAWVTENTYRDHEGIHYADHTHYLFKDLFASGSVVTKPNDHLGVLQGFHGCEYGIGAAVNQSNSKITIGHRHRPSIQNGLHVVGFAGDNPAYQSGLNASAQAFSTLYPNGKRVMYVNL